jgi:hypothetical protein
MFIAVLYTFKIKKKKKHSYNRAVTVKAQAAAQLIKLTALALLMQWQPWRYPIQYTVLQIKIIITFLTMSRAKKSL